MSLIGVPSRGCNIERKVISSKGECASSPPEVSGIEADPDLGAGRTRAWFQAQAHRQSLAVAMSLQENEDQSFIEAVSDLCLDEGAR